MRDAKYAGKENVRKTLDYVKKLNQNCKKSVKGLKNQLIYHDYKKADAAGFEPPQEGFRIIVLAK